MVHKPRSLADIPMSTRPDEILTLLETSGLIDVTRDLDFTPLIETIFRIPNWLFPHVQQSRASARAAFGVAPVAQRNVILKTLVPFFNTVRISYNLRTRRRAVTRDTLLNHMSVFLDVTHDEIEVALGRVRVPSPNVSFTDGDYEPEIEEEEEEEGPRKCQCTD